jgi:hypothetical protein
MMNFFEGMVGGGRHLQGVGLILMGLVVTLGQWSEAIELVGNGIDLTRSHFTNAVEYERLDHIRVGNSIDYAESVLGSPEVIKDLGEGLSANYFFDSKYILTLLYTRNRVDAFTIVALEPDFHYEYNEGEELLSRPLSSYPEPMRVDANDVETEEEASLASGAGTGVYYLERHGQGRAGAYITQYLGYVSYGDRVYPEISQLENAQAVGNTARADELRRTVRAELMPNLYGEGRLRMDQLQESLLTSAEFKYYKK